MVLKTKSCEECGEEYVPVEFQFDRQKYCSMRCKWRKQSKNQKAAGIFKGGYSRETHIRLWLEAMGEPDISVPCHYCSVPLYPDTFVIEHKKPRKDLKNRKEMTAIENLVLSCHPCNKEKGVMDYEEFVCLKS